MLSIYEHWCLLEGVLSPIQEQIDFVPLIILLPDSEVVFIRIYFEISVEAKPKEYRCLRSFHFLLFPTVIGIFQYWFFFIQLKQPEITRFCLFWIISSAVKLHMTWFYLVLESKIESIVIRFYKHLWNIRIRVLLLLLFGERYIISFLEVMSWGGAQLTCRFI